MPTAADHDEIRPAQPIGVAAFAFAMLFPTAMTWVYFVALGAPEGSSAGATSVAYSLGKLLQFGFPVVCIAWKEPVRFGWPRVDGTGLIWGVGFAILVGGSMAATYFGLLKGSPWLGETPLRVRDKVLSFGIASFPAYLAFALFLSAVHSGLEEYYWRWFVYAGLRPRIGTAAAAALSGLAFMLHHVVVLGVYFPHRFWSLAMPFSFGVAIGGAVWAWLYERSGSILSSWVSHALVDAAILAIGWDLIRSAGQG